MWINFIDTKRDGFQCIIQYPILLHHQCLGHYSMQLHHPHPNCSLLLHPTSPHMSSLKHTMPSYSTTHVLGTADNPIHTPHLEHYAILGHHPCPRRGILFHPTSPPMPQEQRTSPTYSPTYVIGGAHSPILLYHPCFRSISLHHPTPLYLNVTGAANYPILLHHPCYMRSALPNPTQPSISQAYQNKYPISKFIYHIVDIRCWMADFRYLISDGTCHMSEAKFNMSDILCLMFICLLYFPNAQQQLQTTVNRFALVCSLNGRSSP